MRLELFKLEYSIEKQCGNTVLNYFSSLSQFNMPNTDESTREKQLHNELKEIASLGNHCAAFGCAKFFGY